MYRSTFLVNKAFIFHMLIGLGDNTILDSFKLTRSKVKVRWGTFVINYVNRRLLHTYLHSHIMSIITIL